MVANALRSAWGRALATRTTVPRTARYPRSPHGLLARNLAARIPARPDRGLWSALRTTEARHARTCSRGARVPKSRVLSIANSANLAVGPAAASPAAPGTSSVHDPSSLRPSTAGNDARATCPRLRIAIKLHARLTASRPPLLGGLRATSRATLASSSARGPSRSTLR